MLSLNHGNCKRIFFFLVEEKKEEVEWEEEGLEIYWKFKDYKFIWNLRVKDLRIYKKYGDLGFVKDGEDEDEI